MGPDEPLYVSADDQRIARMHALAALIFLTIYLALATWPLLGSDPFGWLVLDLTILPFGFLANGVLAALHVVLPTLTRRPISGSGISAFLCWLSALTLASAILSAALQWSDPGKEFALIVLFLFVLFVLLLPWIKSLQFFGAFLGKDSWKNPSTPFFVVAIVGAPMVATFIFGKIVWGAIFRHFDLYEAVRRQVALLMMTAFTPVSLGFAIWSIAPRGSPSAKFDFLRDVGLGFLMYAIGWQAMGASFAPSLLGDYLFSWVSLVAWCAAYFTVLGACIYARVTTRESREPTGAFWWFAWSGAWLTLAGVAILVVKTRYGDLTRVGGLVLRLGLSRLAFFAWPLGCFIGVVTRLTPAAGDSRSKTTRGHWFAFGLLTIGILAPVIGWIYAEILYIESGGSRSLFRKEWPSQKISYFLRLVGDGLVAGGLFFLANRRHSRRRG